MIIIPTFNAEGCIEKSLVSLSNQTHNKYPIWVVDNASTDNTLKIAKQFSKVNLYRHKQNIGRIENWNFCLKLGKEKSRLFIKLLMAGDTLEPTAIETYVGIFKKYANVGIIHSDFYIVHDSSKEPMHGKMMQEKGGVIPTKQALKKLTMFNHMGSLSNVAFRRKCITDYMTFDHALEWASDYYFYTKVCKLFDSYYVDRILSTMNVSYRKFFSQNQSSLTSRLEEFFVQQKALKSLIE